MRACFSGGVNTDLLRSGRSAGLVVGWDVLGGDFSEAARFGAEDSLCSRLSVGGWVHS